MADRIYVTVSADTDIDGNITPLWLEFRGMRYVIDRVIGKPIPSAALLAGGIGMRYTVRIQSKETYLFRTDEYRWFVEGKVPSIIA